MQNEEIKKTSFIDVLGEESVSVSELFLNYNFTYFDRYKESVWSKIQTKYGDMMADGSMGKIDIKRMCPNSQESLIGQLEYPTNIISVPYYFDYQVSDEPLKRWYLNFADPALFVACKGSLFAQDEIQALEHPLLCAIKDYLHESAIEGLKPYTIECGRPTPFLFSNVPNFVEINTMPVLDDGTRVSIYGNAFSFHEHHNPNALDIAIRIRDSFRFSNIIAMAAPVPGYGYYEKETISQMLLNVIAAFEGAKIMSSGQSIEIHTGRWGAGAFGGNEELALIVQIIGAKIAEIDNLVFHAVTNSCLEHAKNEVNAIMHLSNANSSVYIDSIVNHLYQKKYLWGVSDGN